MSTYTDIVKITNAGKSPLVFTGPHNGWALPERYFIDGMPLGLEPYWFDPLAPNRRHEACDWGMAPLFDEIAKQAPDIGLIAGNYSRLLIDLNRAPALTIYEGSSENGQAIPGNTNLSEEEKLERLKNFYMPYHNTVDQILQDAKEKFDHAIWIDLHSFTPIWNGEPRKVGVGTLKTEVTPLNKKAEAFLEKTFGPLFVPDQPYPMSISPYKEMSSGTQISERNGVEYFGIEIRNDLLSTETQIHGMAEQMIKLIKTLCE